MMPWIVSGRSTSSPRSISARAYCSAYSGLPPILASSGWCVICFERRPLEQRRHQLSSGAFRERREREGCRVRFAAAPAGAPLEQLRPGGREDEQWNVADTVDELVDEVEQRIIGPVEILENQHQRARLGERLEQATPSRERLAGACGVILRGGANQGA